jgi:hypothetical protein
MRVAIILALLIFMFALMGGYTPWLDSGQKALSLLVTAGIANALLGRRRR